MDLTTVIIIIAVIILAYFIYVYNKIIKAKNMNKEAFSNVDVALKQRYDLIPNLVETVKGYANYEGDILKKVAELRGGNAKISARGNLETDFSNEIKSVLAIMENYPNLKASEGFIKFQEGLTKVEETIEMARRYYNGTTREYNILIQKFPNNIIAMITNSKPKDYFEVDLVTRQSPKVNMN